MLGESTRSSSDGVEWTRSSNPPPITNDPAQTVFTAFDKIWAITESGEIFSSPDGDAWTLLERNVPWDATLYGQGVSFRGRLWIFVAEEMGAAWSSETGANWRREPLEFPCWLDKDDQFVVAGEQLILGKHDHGYPTKHYRWESGSNWTFIAPHWEHYYPTGTRLVTCGEVTWMIGGRFDLGSDAGGIDEPRHVWQDGG